MVLSDEEVLDTEHQIVPTSQPQSALPWRDRTILSHEFYHAMDKNRAGILNTASQLADPISDKRESFRLRLDLNLELEVRLRARLHGDLTLALL